MSNFEKEVKKAIDDYFNNHKRYEDLKSYVIFDIGKRKQNVNELIKYRSEVEDYLTTRASNINELSQIDSEYLSNDCWFNFGDDEGIFDIEIEDYWRISSYCEKLLKDLKTRSLNYILEEYKKFICYGFGWTYWNCGNEFYIDFNSYSYENGFSIGGLIKNQVDMLNINLKVQLQERIGHNEHLVNIIEEIVKNVMSNYEKIITFKRKVKE